MKAVMNPTGLPIHHPMAPTMVAPDESHGHLCISVAVRTRPELELAARHPLERQQRGQNDSVQRNARARALAESHHGSHLRVELRGTAVHEVALHGGGAVGRQRVQ